MDVDNLFLPPVPTTVFEDEVANQSEIASFHGDSVNMDSCDDVTKFKGGNFGLVSLM